MKRILALTLSLASIAFGAVAANAATTPASTIAATGIAPQVFVRIGPQRRRRGFYRRPMQVTTQTRIVRYGWRTYRETYQVRYLPNGMTQTVLLSRERID